MSKKVKFLKLFKKGTRNRMAIGIALMFLQSFTGVNIITYVCTIPGPPLEYEIAC